MAKSDRMYSKSPKIEKDDKGKPGIKKPSEATKEDIGLSGNPSPGAGTSMPIDVHETERLDLGKRHVDELKDMHKRHAEDFEKMHSRQATARSQESKSEIKTEEVK